MPGRHDAKILVLGIADLTGITTMLLTLYVFWQNPLNDAGLAIAGICKAYCRIMLRFYGKNVRILPKKLAALVHRPS